MPVFAFLIAITVAGLGAVLEASAIAFWIIKFVGATYLVYVGIQILRKARALASMQSSKTSVPALMKRDFAIAITNPKAIAIFGHSFRIFSLKARRSGRN